jgi:hypothetical protein
MQPTGRGAKVRSWAVATAALAVLGSLVACGPPTPPSGPVEWRATTRLWDPASGAERVLTATNSSWWAVVSTDSGLTGAATLELYPRTGADGAPAATPAQTFDLGPVASDLALSEHLLAVRVRNGLAGLDEHRIFELDGDGATGVWSAATLVPTAIDTWRSPTIDLSEDTLVVGRPGLPGSGVEGSVLIVPLQTAGPGVSWSFGAVQQLVVDPTWSLDARTGFGTQVALEGDTLASGTTDGHVLVARRNAGTWAVDQVLTDPAGPGTGFGKSLAVDEVAGVGRLLIGVQGRFQNGAPRPGRVDLYQRGGGSWALARSLAPRPDSAVDGSGFGYLVALDGDTAAVGVHWTRPAQPGGVGTVDDLQVELHDLTAASSYVAAVSLLDLAGGPRDGLSSVGPVALDLAGSHLAVSALHSASGGVAHLFAISVDRRPG